MTFFLPFQSIVPIHGLVQLSSNTTRSLLLRKYIDYKLLIPFALGTPIGGYLGYSLLSRIKDPTWFLGIIILLLLYVALKPKKLPLIHIPKKAFFILGILAACLGCLIGATGPFLAPFFIRNDLKKETIVASKATCQCIIHLIKIPIFLALAFPYQDHLVMIGLMIIAVIAGTKFGTYLLQKINGKQFIGLIKIAMVVIAVRLSIKLYFLFI